MLVLQMGKKFGLIVWLSFIDDMLIVCSADAMESIKNSVMVQSLNDKFNFAELNSKPEMPALARRHLMDSGPKLCGAVQMRYHSGVENCCIW